MAVAKNIEVLCTIPFPEAVMQKLKAVSPRIKLTLLPAQQVSDIPDEVWNKTEVLYTDVLLPEPDLVPNLKWIQFHYAGIDFLHGSSLLELPNLIFSSMSGGSAIQEAEYILLMLLSMSHCMPELVANQVRKEWPNDRWDKFTPVELSYSTVGLVGYGSINRELARLLQPFNVKVLAVKKDAMRPIDGGYSIEGHGDPEGNYFHRLYPVEALKQMLKLCDFVVVALPLTPETVGLIGQEEIHSMKTGAFLIHVSRGGIVDEQALSNALTEHKLAGAALDVFSQEPLPEESSLWKVPNLIITPHVSGFSPKYKERAGEMFIENLNRYLHGEPVLNQYDPKRYY